MAHDREYASSLIGERYMDMNVAEYIRETAEDICPESTASILVPLNSHEYPLFSTEEACIAGSHKRRRVAFSTARYCARLSLALSGHGIHEIPVGEYGQPIWPADTVGSISHGGGFAWAVSGRSNQFASLGIDIDAIESISPRLRSKILTKEELSSDKTAENAAVALHFSVKEAVYKAHFQYKNTTLSFLDISISMSTPRSGLAAISTVAEGIKYCGSCWNDGTTVLSICWPCSIQ